MNRTQAQYERVVFACQRHLERMQWAAAQIAPLQPFSANALAAAEPLTVAHIDQFIFRLGRLQDTMGNQLFPTVLHLVGEPLMDKTFIDKLNLLEKFGAIPSAKDWQHYRELRNQLSHDYPENAELQAVVLNNALVAAGELAKVLRCVAAFVQPYFVAESAD